MKNKEVVILFIIVLLVTTPLVVADNFLSGYSILDSAKSFFSGIIDSAKNLFIKKEVAGIADVSPSTDLSATFNPSP